LTGENRRTRRKTCPSATLSTTNPAWIDPVANPGLRGERPATNDLSHVTALVRVLFCWENDSIHLCRNNEVYEHHLFCDGIGVLNEDSVLLEVACIMYDAP
jgi:hypothetical protein